MRGRRKEGGGRNGCEGGLSKSCFDIPTSTLDSDKMTYTMKTTKPTADTDTRILFRVAMDH